LKGHKPEVYGDRSRVEVEDQRPFKFKGTMEELLTSTGDLCAQETSADE